MGFSRQEHWGGQPFPSPGVFPTQGSNPGLLHRRQILYRLSERCLAVPDSLRPHGLYSPWNSPGQNTGVGSLSLLQQIFPNPGTEPRSPSFQVVSLPAEPQGEPSLPSELKWSEVAQPCPTLCDPVDCSLPGSSVRGIFQARVLEWVSISFSRGSSRPGDWTWVSCIVGRCFTIRATGKY